MKASPLLVSSPIILLRVSGPDCFPSLFLMLNRSANNSCLFLASFASSNPSATALGTSFASKLFSATMFRPMSATPFFERKASFDAWITAFAADVPSYMCEAINRFTDFLVSSETKAGSTKASGSTSPYAMYCQSFRPVDGTKTSPSRSYIR